MSSSSNHKSPSQDNSDPSTVAGSARDAGEESQASQEADLGADDYQKELEELRSEAIEHKDRYLRQLAELDNMRKRHDKERSDLRKFGAESLVKDILPVLDGFEKVEVGPQGSNEDDALRTGLILLKKNLFDVLAKHGLKAIDAENADFDPNFHQAIQRVEKDDLDHEIVLQVFAKGYLLNDRLIRPAMVSVGVPKDSSDS